MPYNIFGRTRYNPYRKNTTSLTQAEQQLLPYVRNEKIKQTQESNWLQPLELISDLLSRGQYVSANLGEDIARIASGESVNPLEGILKGITGERKGTWGKTLFGGKDIGESNNFKGIFQNTPEWMKTKVDIPIIGPTNIQDVIGFMGDVIIDPTTYISFGSTKVAKSIANDFAERSIKIAIKNLDDIGDLAKLYQKGLNKTKLTNLIAKNPDSALKLVGKLDKNGGVARYLNNVYKQSYDKALRSTPEQLKQELISIFNNAKNATTENILNTNVGKITGIPFLDELSKKMTPEEFIKNAGNETAGLYNKLQSLNSDIADINKLNYTGAGETAINLFGREAFQKYRGDSQLAKSWNTFKDSIQNSKIKGIYDDAVWSVTNNGPIGWIRKIFGFRNPYQTMLNVKKNAATNGFQFMAEQKVKEVQDIFKGYDEFSRSKVRDIIARAEFQNIGVENIFSNKKALSVLGIDEKTFPKIKELAFKIKDYSQALRSEEMKLVKEGLLQGFGEIGNYLPNVKNKKSIYNSKSTNPLGSKSPRFTNERSNATINTINQESQKLSILLGIDVDTAKYLVTEKNWGSTNMNLEEMFMHRSIAHSQAVANANMLKQFKEFGISIDDIDPEILKNNPDIVAALSRTDAELNEVGLYHAQNAVLSKYWFDKDVSDIINRSIGVASSDEGVQWFLNKARSFSSWWKGMTTLTPGFHLRNAQSNNTQLFLKFGPRAFNPKQSFDALIGTAYALHGDEIFKKLKISDEVINRTLEKRIGNVSIRDLAMEARKSGVISKNIMGFDVETTVKELGTKKKATDLLNIFSKDNLAFRGSRAIGEVIESTPKFQSMLMDLQDMSKTVGDISKYHIDYAVMDAKKWFFDYSDLTEAEQKYLKPIIPFYTWIRKNIALQLTNIVNIKSTVRNMYALGFKAQNSIAEDYDQSKLPEWMRESGYIVTGENDKNVNTLATLPGISFPGPIADINKLPFRFQMTEAGIPVPVWTPEEIRDEIMSSANPLLKSIVNVYLRQDEGWDYFKKRALKDTEDAPRILSLFLDKPYVMQFVDGILRVAGFKDGLQAERGDDGQLKIDGKVKQVLEDNFIVIQRLDNLLDTTTTFIPQLKDWLEKNVDYKDNTNEMDKFFKTMSFLFGIKRKDFEKSVEEEIRIRDIMKKAQEKRSQDMKKTPGYEKRRSDYEVAYQRKIRRLGF